MTHTIENHARLIHAAITDSGRSLARLCALATTIARHSDHTDHHDTDRCWTDRDLSITVRQLGTDCPPITRQQAIAIAADILDRGTQIEAIPTADRADHDYRIARAWLDMADAIDRRIAFTFRRA